MNIRTIVITVAAALALVAGGTAAGAAITGPVSSNGTIHGCYDTGGNLKVIDSSATCPKGYTPLNWSQTGGSATAGPGGLDVMFVQTTGTGAATAVCPADHPYLLGGGTDATQSTGLVTASRPVQADQPGPGGPVTGPETGQLGWHGEAIGSTPSGVVTWAICAK